MLFDDPEYGARARARRSQLYGEAGEGRSARRLYRAVADPPGHGINARLGLAQISLWTGFYLRAMQLFEPLAQVPDKRVRSMARLGIASVYSQTGRPLLALEGLERILAADPTFAEATAEYQRMQQYFRPTVVPSLSLYTERNSVTVFSSRLSGAVPLNRHLRLLADAGLWIMSDTSELVIAEQVNAGAALWWKSWRGSFKIGPRFSAHFDPSFGLNLDVTARPTTWLGVSLSYGLDEVYHRVNQPGALAARIRGSFVDGRVELLMPYRITASAQVGGRFFDPDNVGLNATWGVNVPVWGPLAVGYHGQWLGWTDHDRGYWSPQAFAAHLFLLQASHSFNPSNLQLVGQVGVGGSAERVAGLYDTDIGLALTGRAAAVWGPRSWLSLRLEFQYSRTTRGINFLGVVDAAAADVGAYWWLSTTISAKITF